MDKDNEKDIVCYACGKKLSESPSSLFVKLREDDDIYICSECISDTYDKLMASREEEDDDDDSEDFIDFPEDDLLEDDDDTEDVYKKLPTPEDIKNHLDQYIIGQEEAKKIISVAAYNHYKALLYDKIHKKDNTVEVKRSNVVLVGATGSGKTEIIRALSKYMNVPLAIADCSSLSKSGCIIL